MQRRDWWFDPPNCQGPNRLISCVITAWLDWFVDPLPLIVVWVEVLLVIYLLLVLLGDLLDYLQATIGQKTFPSNCVPAGQLSVPPLILSPLTQISLVQG